MKIKDVSNELDAFASQMRELFNTTKKELKCKGRGELLGLMEIATRAVEDAADEAYEMEALA